MSPSPSTITKQQLSHCIDIYPAVVERAYAQRSKGNEKKVAEKVERDGWRYETLPKEVDRKGAGEGEGGIGLTLAQVERLVQWKM